MHNSRYSVVQYGNFENFAIDEYGSCNDAFATFWQTESSTFSPEITLTPFGNVGKITGNISEEKYLKQTVCKASDLLLSAYDDGMIFPDTPNTFTVSGFAKGVGQVVGTNSNFRLNVVVHYYKGAGRPDETQSFAFDFQGECSDWQFVSGVFHTKATSLIRYIDVFCEYSHQPGGSVALFDNIALIQGEDQNLVTYYYYTDDPSVCNTARSVEYKPHLAGLVHVKMNGYRTEVYEYNNARQLIHMANDRGEVYEYFYNDENVASVIYYTFSGIYPALTENAFYNLNKTPKTRTDYIYTAQGQRYYEDTYNAIYAGNSQTVVADDNALHFHRNLTYKTTAGSRIFGALLSEENALGEQTQYFYDETSGRLLAKMQYDKQEGVCYSYDAIGNLIEARPATYNVSHSDYQPINNAESVSYTYNAQNRLAEIATESSVYSFCYDVFGNTSSVNVGNTQLAGYVFNENNGKLKQINYGNGYTEKYVYDELDRVTELWYNQDGTGWVKAYAYTYTSSGQLHRFDNLLTGRSTLYKYDISGKLTSFADFDTDSYTTDISSHISYNEKGWLRTQYYDFDYPVSSATYATNSVWYHNNFLADGRLNYYRVDAPAVNGRIDFTYDALLRPTSKTLSFALTGNSAVHFTNQIIYGYDVVSNNRTTARVSEYISNINGSTSADYRYIYDQKGNITHITDKNWNILCHYSYDDLDQLIREDNQPLGKTYVYTYDNAGNITSKKEYAYTLGTLGTTQHTYNYTYGDSDWGDLLTEWYGQSIEYDEIGNPTFIGQRYGSDWAGSVLEWEGRRLVSYEVAEDFYGDHSQYQYVTYTYNADGIRTSKNVFGVLHTYYLDGNRIIMETVSQNGAEQYRLIYLYDETGAPIGMQHRTPSMASNEFYTFWFEKNLQGDIVAVYNEYGDKLISYTYDAWGNFSSSWINLAGTNYYATLNPFRYRGYYYDSETYFYYLNSRYYNPSWGRFLNADGYVNANGDIIGFNMFAYCGNNPVMRVDPTGEFWWIVAIVVVAVVSVALSSCSAQPTSDVGCATPYNAVSGDPSNPKSPNCYAYAIGSTVNEQPGQASGRYPTEWNNVEDVGKSVEADMKATGRSIRRISGPDAKVYDNEYKIALRVGTTPYAVDKRTGTLYYDYHFMRQTSTGQWTEKHGYGGDSILHGVGENPNTIPWTLSGVSYYDSPIIYYAIGR